MVIVMVVVMAVVIVVLVLVPRKSSPARMQRN